MLTYRLLEEKKMGRDQEESRQNFGVQPDVHEHRMSAIKQVHNTVQCVYVRVWCVSVCVVCVCVCGVCLCVCLCRS